jgi:hypothetical protein
MFPSRPSSLLYPNCLWLPLDRPPGNSVALPVALSVGSVFVSALGDATSSLGTPHRVREFRFEDHQMYVTVDVCIFDTKKVYTHAYHCIFNTKERCTLTHTTVYIRYQKKVYTHTTVYIQYQRKVYTHAYSRILLPFPADCWLTGFSNTVPYLSLTPHFLTSTPTTTTTRRESQPPDRVD